mgnify:CR=1 FL=1
MSYKAQRNAEILYHTGSNDSADAITEYSIFKVTILISIRLRDAGILSVVLWFFYALITRLEMIDL